jgi:hypothetical protein
MPAPVAPPARTSALLFAASSFLLSTGILTTSFIFTSFVDRQLAADADGTDMDEGTVIAWHIGNAVWHWALMSAGGSAAGVLGLLAVRLFLSLPVAKQPRSWHTGIDESYFAHTAKREGPTSLCRDDRPRFSRDDSPYAPPSPPHRHSRPLSTLQHLPLFLDLRSRLLLPLTFLSLPFFLRLLLRLIHPLPLRLPLPPPLGHRNLRRKLAQRHGSRHSRLRRREGFEGLRSVGQLGDEC